MAKCRRFADDGAETAAGHLADGRQQMGSDAQGCRAADASAVRDGMVEALIAEYAERPADAVGAAARRAGAEQSRL